MNVIFVLCDSLRPDHLGCYGNTTVQTPNFDRLSQLGVTFENAYLSSAPCMPARRDIWTGRYEFPWRGWGPLEQSDVDLPGVLQNAGVKTALITDHYHLFEHGSGNYHYHFDTWEFIRGHENDRWINDPTIPITWPAPSYEKCHIRWDQYFQNTAQWRDGLRWRSESDAFAAQVFTSAAEWVSHHHTEDPFFLLIDCFDPHEPFDPPPPYDTMYASEIPEARIRWPIYGTADRYTEAEIKDIRALYAGKVTLTDTWFGHFLDRVERLGLLDNTMIILTADHGHILGERGMIGKPGAHHGDSNLYEQIARIPCIVYHPDFKNQDLRPLQLVQLVDFFPTILETLNILPPENVALHGGSLIPLVQDSNAQIRDVACFAKYGEGVGISDGRWTLFQWPSGETNQPLYWYSVLQPEFLKPKNLGPFDPTQKRYPVGTVRGPNTSSLFDLDTDPGQIQNLLDVHPEQTVRLRDHLRAFFNRIDAPPEQQERLGL
ncbi:MAG: sulfatase [bacterium]|nr:sulfatase [bacterium]